MDRLIDWLCLGLLVLLIRCCSGFSLLCSLRFRFSLRLSGSLLLLLHSLLVHLHYCGAEKVLQAGLRRLLSRLLQSLCCRLKSLLGKGILLHKKFLQALQVRLLRLQLLRVLHTRNRWVLKELSDGLEVETALLRQLRPLRLQFFHDCVNVFVFLHHLERRLRSDPLDRIAVVTPAENAEVNELVHGDLEVLQQNGQIDLNDRVPSNLLLTQIQVTHLHGSPEGQSVGIVRPCAIHETLLRQRCAGGLCVGGCLHHGDAHQGEEPLDVLVVLAGDVNGPPNELFDVVLVAGLLGLLQVRLCLRTFVGSLQKLPALQLPGFAVEDVHRFDPSVEESDHPVEESCDVTGRFPLLVGQVRKVLAVSDGDHELIQTHRGVNRQLPPCVILQFDLFDGSGGPVVDEFHQPLDPHLEFLSLGL
mmetsp:Transcript_42637/g.84102  ORF Transcript_42637/g.84102 Transcript_42637/m.84102 type:complete len:417 (+) Transcript_42637:974-2224(+)